MSHPLERTTSNSSVATVTGNADRESANPNAKTLRYQNTYVCRVSLSSSTHVHVSIDRISSLIQGMAVCESTKIRMVLRKVEQTKRSMPGIRPLGMPLDRHSRQAIATVNTSNPQPRNKTLKTPPRTNPPQPHSNPGADRSRPFTSGRSTRHSS